VRPFLLRLVKSGFHSGEATSLCICCNSTARKADIVSTPPYESSSRLDHFACTDDGLFPGRA
jgi:hypothetical protein